MLFTRRDQTNYWWDMWHSKTILESKNRGIRQANRFFKRDQAISYKKIKTDQDNWRGFSSIEEIVELQEEHMVLSEVLETDDLLTIFNAAYQLLNDEGSICLPITAIIYMIHSNKKFWIAEMRYMIIFFLEKDQAAEGTYVKPAGHYLTMLYSGAEAELYKAYDKIQKYVSDKRYELTGYFYEFPIHPKYIEAGGIHYGDTSQV